MRGPLLAIEGDNADAVKELGTWLSKTLSKSDDLKVKLVEGPSVAVEAGKQKIMSHYHRLAADWLEKSGEILESLSMKPASPEVDSVMEDATTTSTQAPRATRAIDESYNDSETSCKPITRSSPHDGKAQESQRVDSVASSGMDVDIASKSSSVSSAHVSAAATSTKPVSIIANYSLFASNFFACHIPITLHDPYSPIAHWTWTATQWRGIVGPDLTIYVRDGMSGVEGSKASVDIMADGNLFSVKRTKMEGKEENEIEPSVLRRLGFEVSEWVRAFGNGAE
jgi:HMG box factor